MGHKMRRFSAPMIARISFWRTTIACAAALASSGLNAAHAEFVLSPLRQVISAESPTARYEISNPSPRTLELRLSWVDLEARAEGYAPASPAHRARTSAAPYLVLSNSFFRLQPGARATFTVHLRKDAQLTDPERRSHLLIESTAVRSPLRKAGSGIQLDVRSGITTPVLVRSGSTARHAHGAHLSGTRLTRTEDGALALETRVEARGGWSSYGALTAEFFPADAGAKEIVGKELGRRANIAAYPQSPARLVTIPLNAASLPAGALSVRYRGDAEFEGTILAARSFTIEAASESNN